MKAGRKPSVLVSRRFSCSEALNLKDLNLKAFSPNGAADVDDALKIPEQKPRLIENGKDVTPKPLGREDLPSIDHVNYLKNNEDDDDGDYDSDADADADADGSSGSDDDSENSKNLLIPMIPKLISSIMDDALLHAKNSVPLRRIRDSIPLYEPPEEALRDNVSANTMTEADESKEESQSLVSSRTFPVKRSKDANVDANANAEERNSSSSGSDSFDKHKQDEGVQTNVPITTSMSTSTVTPEIQDSSTGPSTSTSTSTSTDDIQCSRNNNNCTSAQGNLSMNIYRKEAVEDIVHAIMMRNKSLLDTSEGKPASASASASASALGLGLGLDTKNDNDNDNNNEDTGDIAGARISTTSFTFQSIVMEKMRLKMFQSKSVHDRLRFLERLVVQNNFITKQRMKRRGDKHDTTNSDHYEHTTTTNSACTSGLEIQFKFHCPMTTQRVVTCMSWHKLHSDVLAVGYSDVQHGIDGNDLNANVNTSLAQDTGRDNGGLILIWSPRNPSFPEKTIQTKSPVTANAFSVKTPTVLAVGMEDGCISLFDTSQHEISSVTSAFVSSRHMSTVTQLTWILAEKQSSNERLISISTDGRVLQWSISKGMCLHPLMTLNRPNVSLESKLPRTAMALCIDFPKNCESTTYVVGCEDGSLFLCSRSYTEKQLHLVNGHKGPVTSVKFSPMDKNVLLSCSADSSIKLWSCCNRQTELKNELEIVPSNLWAPINDVAWSTVSATVFAMVSADGRIQIWDIAESRLDPVMKIVPQPSSTRSAEFTKILFTDRNQIVVGNDHGEVAIYSIGETKARSTEHLYQCWKKS